MAAALFFFRKFGQISAINLHDTGLNQGFLCLYAYWNVQRVYRNDFRVSIWRTFRSFYEIRTMNLLKFCVKLPNIKDFCIHLYIQMYEEFIWMIYEFASAWRNLRWRLFEIFLDMNENLVYVQDLLVERAKEFENGDNYYVNDVIFAICPEGHQRWFNVPTSGGT